MARAIHRLSARGVLTLPPGKHADGGNLFLRVDPSGARRWCFLYARNGKQHELGLGSALTVSLAQARETASSYRSILAQGGDPKAVKAQAAAVAIPTFQAFATSLLADIQSAWRSEKHRGQWQATLATYVFPAIGRWPIDQIDTAAVLKVLKPIWSAKPETAARVRGRVERVLDAAKAQGLIASPWENPGRWRGHLDHLLPARQALSRGQHAALPYAELPSFMRQLEAYPGVAGRALELVVLTASRTNEVLGMRWSEVDLETATWVVPASRMKAAKLHRVPLSEAAVTLLRGMERMRNGDDGYVFPGARPNKPLGGHALATVAQRLGCTSTVHGFRSSFRDWCAETTSTPHDIAEACLAHVTGSTTSRAYRRSDLLELRRPVMEAWSRYLSGGAAIVALRPVVAG